MKSLKSHVLASLCAVLLVTAVAGPAPADEAGRKVYEQTLRATAFVASKFGTGSGWIVDRDAKLLITNYHVVQTEDSAVVFFPIYQKGEVVAERKFYADNAKLIRGKVIDADPKRDLALVELESLPAEVEALKLAAQSPKVGDSVHSVGNPGASQALWVYTSGTVRQVYVMKISYGDSQRIETRMVETQSPTNHGDSGGPTVNDRGELVGVVSGGISSLDANLEVTQLMSWSIDVQEVRAFLDETRPLLHPRTAAEYNRRGIHYWNRGRNDRAVADYTEAIKLDDRHAVYYRNRGMAFVRKGDYVTGIADLDEVLRRDAKDERAYNWRAWAYLLKGDNDKSIDDYTQAIRLNPKQCSYYCGRASGYHKKRDYDRALADCDEGLRLDPNDPGLYNRRGWIRYDMKQYDRAIADYDEALKLAPTWSVTFRNRGLAWSCQGDQVKACNDFSACLRLNPTDAVAYNYRGNVLRALKYYKEAVADYTAAIKYKHPALHAVYCGRGLAYQALGDERQAAADLREADRLQAASK